MKKKRFFIIRIILIVLASLFIGYGIYMMNASLLQGSIPMPFGFGLAEVVSPSMQTEDPENTINVGDVILIVASKNVKVGDVVVFKDKENMTVTHRIIAENEDGTFRTKGDNPENGEDPDSLEKKNIIGKYTGIKFTKIKSLLNVLRNPAIMILMIIVIIFLLVLSGKKEKESEKAEISKVKQEIESLKGESTDLTAEEIQAQIDALKKEAEKKNKKGK